VTLLTLLQQQAGGATDANAAPGAGSLTLQGYAPTVSAVSSATAAPGTGALVLTGYPPTVTVPTSVSVSPGAGALVITGYAPRVSAGGASQDFRNVLDGPGEDYWLRKKKREKEEKQEREAERLAALEVELKQVEAETAPRKKVRTRKAIEPVQPEPVADPIPTKPRATYKRKVQETPELMRAKAIATEAATVAAAQAEARARQDDEEAAIILLLAA
jgi:hypothetical protein